MTGIVCLYVFGGYMMSSMKNMAAGYFTSLSHAELTPANLYTLLLQTCSVILLLLAPLVVTIIATALVSSLLQENGKLDFNLQRLSMSFDRLNPINGFGRFFNKDALMEMVKSLLKLLVVGIISYRIMKDESQNITFLATADIETIISYVGHIAFKIVIHTGGILLILGVLDMLYVKWRYIENLKMTKQEVKDEHRETEGNPEIKGKIKRAQFQMARKRMIKIVPTADVVITNPTHFAVALKYDREKMFAPVVIAKGADVMAQAIKKIAKEHDVVLVENRFLARELYDQVDENETIPEALYAAVAEVLAYVYKLKGKV